MQSLYGRSPVCESFSGAHRCIKYIGSRRFNVSELSLLGVQISNDTIQRLYDRIEFIDNPDVEEIGVDDVAIRKGQTYATAIYDLRDHHLIALLDGRDGEPLKEWLKSHNKVRLVARDRASAYASAINEILPDCMQVAARFHLLLLASGDFNHPEPLKIDQF